MLTVYGIPNCNTVKKARAWLDDQGLPHVFHDFKKQGVPPAQLDNWIAAIGWEALINRQGTTWRKLEEPVKQSIQDAVSGKTLMLQYPSVIKRPVYERNGALIGVGFTSELTSILAST
jgi:arsenate reductase (glutaredoxin)